MAQAAVVINNIELVSFSIAAQPSAVLTWRMGLKPWEHSWCCLQLRQCHALLPGWQCCSTACGFTCPTSPNRSEMVCWWLQVSDRRCHLPASKVDKVQQTEEICPMGTSSSSTCLMISRPLLAQSTPKCLLQTATQYATYCLICSIRTLTVHNTALTTYCTFWCIWVFPLCTSTRNVA